MHLSTNPGSSQSLMDPLWGLFREVLVSRCAAPTPKLNSPTVPFIPFGHGFPRPQILVLSTCQPVLLFVLPFVVPNNPRGLPRGWEGILGHLGVRCVASSLTFCNLQGDVPAYRFKSSTLGQSRIWLARCQTLLAVLRMSPQPRDGMATRGCE